MADTAACPRPHARRTASTARSGGCARCCCTGPGPELKRLTPRNNDKLLFDGIPWVGRAQDEHDAFAQALRDHGVEVLYLADLLAEALEVAAGARPRRSRRVLRRPAARRRRCTGDRGLPARAAPGRPGRRP